MNEKGGGATNRADPSGRLRLLATNTKIYQEIVPQIVKAAPRALLLVVTDPPDPLADVTRSLAGHDRVLSTGTFLDSLRFRVHLAGKLDVDPTAVEAMIIGEHGTSEVFLWSAARVSGIPLPRVLSPTGASYEDFRKQSEGEVRYANITIIEGNNASQYGIGMVSARIAEIILREERAVLPIGVYHESFGVTLSLPTVLGRQGAIRVLEPEMTNEERTALQHSAEQVRQALRPAA